MARSATSRKAAAEWANKPAKLRQKDRDARWTIICTNARPSEESMPRVDLAIPAFGYKNRLGIDRRHRLIRRWTVTNATRHDGAVLPKLIDINNTASDVWADTTYRSKANKNFLAGRLLRSQITARSPEVSRCRAAPGPMPTNRRRCARQSSTPFARQKDPMRLFSRTIGNARARTRQSPLQHLANGLAYRPARANLMSHNDRGRSASMPNPHYEITRPLMRSMPGSFPPENAVVGGFQVSCPA
jgi:hypothetical protein